MNGVSAEMSVLELIQMEKILNSDDAFWGGANGDVLMNPIPSHPSFFANDWNDELGAVLNPASRSKSPFESCFPVHAVALNEEALSSDCNTRKRPAESHGKETEKKKMKACEEEDSKASEQYSNCNSKSKSTTTAENRKRSAASKSGSTSKAGDAPKTDYIHVRARRGQATDSHSLAERVRREKISERMKYLQDLVPGCHKITGKASMLDEIINYVQSLQRQVEFLSMRLAAASSRPDLDLERYLSKAIYPSIPQPPEVINSAAAMQFYLDAVTQMGFSPIPDTFLDSQTRHQNDLQNPFILQPFSVDEGFTVTGNVKMELP